MRPLSRIRGDLPIIAQDDAKVVSNTSAATHARTTTIKRFGHYAGTMALFVVYIGAIIVPKTMIWISHFHH